MTGARRVVVTGAGVVSPVGIGRSAFHDSLVAGRSGIDSISLFDASRFVTSIAAEVKGYDPGAFVDLPGEVAPALADRKVGFVLGAARMALDEAFGRSWSIPYPAGARGLSLGVGVEIFKMDDIVPWCREQGDLDPEALARHLAGRSFMDSFRIPSDLGPAILGRLAGVHGPRRVNVGACVASAQAIGEGFRMVQRGRAQLVLAGGADSMINPLAVAGFGLLAATTGSSHLKGRASRPFDLNRDGFVLGEGAAVVVLEERTAARARGARILAEIAGYGTSMDAFKITDPAEDGAGAIQS
ncbi:MAG: beta-ketoacyl-[acyl-carrier-protein] synthase II, partial [Candidatus Riflebacteria bacterium]|nr:beta-ketoacyl-[acyl-carrier-protein] synthase II [Candidatus Riflebacteria bacterium]